MSLLKLILFGVITVACVIVSGCGAFTPKDSTASSPELHEFSGQSGYRREYVCHVSNLATDKVFAGRDVNKNIAIKEAREACLQGADPQQCSVHFSC